MTLLKVEADCMKMKGGVRDSIYLNGERHGPAPAHEFVMNNEDLKRWY